MPGADTQGQKRVVQRRGVRYSPRAVLRRKGTNGIGNETAGVVKYFSGRLLWLLWCGQAVNYPLATGGGCRLSATLVTALNRRSEQESQSWWRAGYKRNQQRRRLPGVVVSISPPSRQRPSSPWLPRRVFLSRSGHRAVRASGPAGPVRSLLEMNSNGPPTQKQRRP